MENELTAAKLVTALLGSTDAAGGGGGEGSLQSPQNSTASNCVSANQRTILSSESSLLKSDSHKGNSAPIGSSCNVRKHTWHLQKRASQSAC